MSDGKEIVAQSMLERALTQCELAGIRADEIRGLVDDRLTGEGFKATASRPAGEPENDEPENLVTRARRAGIEVKTLSDFKAAKAALDGAA